VTCNTTYNNIKKRRKEKATALKTRNLQTEPVKIGYNSAMIAYKQDNATVAKYPPKAATAAKHPPTKTTAAKYPPKCPLQRSICRGNGHDTLGSKASARAEANDNGGKASARKNDSGKASAMRGRRRQQGRLLQEKPLRVEHRRIQAQ